MNNTTSDLDRNINTETQHTDYDCTLVDTNTHTDLDCILIGTETCTDSDTTPLLHVYTPWQIHVWTPKQFETCSDSTPVLHVHSSTNSSTHKLTDGQENDSDSDTTPLIHFVPDPDRTPLIHLVHTCTDGQKQQEYDGDSGATPLIHFVPDPNRTPLIHFVPTCTTTTTTIQWTLPKRLFTTKNSNWWCLPRVIRFFLHRADFSIFKQLF